MDQAGSEESTGMLLGRSVGFFLLMFFVSSFLGIVVAIISALVRRTYLGLPCGRKT